MPFAGWVLFWFSQDKKNAGPSNIHSLHIHRSVIIIIEYRQKPCSIWIFCLCLKLYLIFTRFNDQISLSSYKCLKAYITSHVYMAMICQNCNLFAIRPISKSIEFLSLQVNSRLCRYSLWMLLEYTSHGNCCSYSSCSIIFFFNVMLLPGPICSRVSLYHYATLHKTTYARQKSVWSLFENLNFDILILLFPYVIARCWWEPGVCVSSKPSFSYSLHW